MDEIEVSLPLDADGFLRRECPHCVRQFKWHHGPANEESEQHEDPLAYHCPFCGQPAGGESWWTQEQLDYMQGVAAPRMAQMVARELDQAFKSVKSDFIRFERTGNFETPDTPMPLVEPDDMVIVTSPCHAYEPVKVPEDHTGTLYCLICGTPYAV